MSPEKKRAMGKSVLYVATDLHGRADCLMTMEFYVESLAFVLCFHRIT